MKWNLLPTALFMTLLLPLSGAELPQGVKAETDGSVSWNGIKISHTNVFGKWQTARREKAEINRQGDRILVRQNHLYPNSAGKGLITLTPIGKNAFQLESRDEVPADIKPNLRYLSLSVPTDNAGKIIFTNPKGTQEFHFPEQYKKMILGHFYQVRKAELCLKDGNRLTFYPQGNTLFLQDDRKFGKRPGQNETFSIRIWHSGNTFSTKVETATVKNTLLDLSAIADRPVRDDIAEDGKGGWTDQGAQNDLRMFQPGIYSAKTIRFEVKQPKVVAIAGKNRTMPVEMRELDLPAGTKAKTLALFHTSAWTPREVPLGELEVVYADTGIQRIPVIGGKDCGNWWNPRELANAKIAWKHRNGTTDVGFYVSTFPLTGSNPIRIRFKSPDPNVVWLIAAATLLDQEVKFKTTVAVPKIMKADHEWMIMDFDHYTVKGSPLDFSFLTKNDAPAGKYGRALPSPDGTMRFEKAPHKKLRIVGTNLCQSALLPEKEDAVRLAEYIASMGINSVRFHHHDNGLVAKGSKVSTAINMENLDRMEFLFAELKKRGIYISFDLYTSRKLLPGDKIPELEKIGSKTAVMLTDPGMKNLKEFCRNWLTHRNPYTGLNWLEDPAIVFINLVNEDTLTYNWQGKKEFLEKLFQNYAAKNGIRDKRATSANLHFLKFMHDIQKEYLQELARFMKEDLKAVYPVTSCNYGDNAATLRIRNLFPVTDTHMYHEHPTFLKNPWSLPHAYSQTSLIPANAYLPTGMICNRVYHKPFFMTEFNFCAPNQFRAEDGPLMGAYSALHDISGIYRFDFNSYHKRFRKEKAIIVFESISDPVMQLSDRIISLLFLRGDVASAKEKYAYTIPADLFSKRRDNGIPGMIPLRLIAQVGVQFEDQKTEKYPEYDKIQSEEIKHRIADYERSGIAVSTTGELKLDTRGKTFSVVTPRSEVFTLHNGGMKGKSFQVRNADSFQTLAALSLTDDPLAESNSILILQLTDVSQEGVRFGNQERTILENTSRGKHLLRKAKAEIELHVKGPMKVSACNMLGETIGEVKATFRNGVLRFKADNSAFKGGTVAYHLTPVK